MGEIWCFSAAGHSLEVAQYLGQALNAPVRRIGEETDAATDLAVVVFPVYCQNIPSPVIQFLSRLPAKQVVLIATYGRMGYGNVLWEGAQLTAGQVIAAAFVPTGHTYLNEKVSVNYEALQPILDRLGDPRPAVIPKLRKWWLADLFPGFRSRIGVKLQKNQNCTQCGLCSTVCPMGAMKNGIPGKNCIRCLRCVAQCPNGAISFTCGPVLRRYLRKPRKCETVIFL